MLNLKPIINLGSIAPTPQCATCGNQEKLVLHHIKPRSEGGGNDPSNLQILCEECHRRVHHIFPHKSELKDLVETLYDIQKVRIAISNRLSRGEDTSLSGVRDYLRKLEKDIERRLRLRLEPEPVYRHYLSKIEGIGPILAANVVALLYDPQRFRSVSALWHYAGYHVENGSAPRLQKRKRVTWNPKLRVLGYKIGKSFVMRGGGYRSRYEEYKEGYPRKNLDLSRGHIDAMARRKTVKLFFRHLWQVWRTLEHLPVTPPYSSQNDATIIKPFVDSPQGTREWDPSLYRSKITPMP
jgi:HNH endonuclease/transposase IS116/IS110/IS902 family protein